VRNIRTSPLLGVDVVLPDDEGGQELLEGRVDGRGLHEHVVVVHLEVPDVVQVLQAHLLLHELLVGEAQLGDVAEK